MFGNLFAIEYIPFAPLPDIAVSINLSDKLIIIHDILLGTNGTEYLTIWLNVFLLSDCLFMYFFTFNCISTISAVAVFAIVFDNNNPFTPILSGNINIIFNIIVLAPKMKFDKEYSFILPSPLDKQLLKFNNILDITNAMNSAPY